MSIPSNALLALVGADTPVGYGGFGANMLLVPSLDIAYFVCEGVLTGSPGIKKFTVGLVGTEDQQATDVDLFGDAGGGIPRHTADMPACYHPRGRLFMSLDTISNSRPIGVVSATSLTGGDAYGVASSSTAASTNGPPFRLIASGQMIGLQADGDDYLVSRALSFTEIAVMRVTNIGGAVGPLIIHLDGIVQNVPMMCVGYSGLARSRSSFFVLGRVFAFAAGDPTPCGLYRYDIVGGVASQTVLNVSIAPADIDPTWTNFVDVSPPGFDRADGNIIAFFCTLDAVATQGYLVKFNAVTGAVMWRFAIPGGNAGLPNVDLTQCNINRVLAVIGMTSTWHVAVVDLRTGTLLDNIEFNHGLSLEGPQIYDFQTGSITLQCQYGESVLGTVPTYLGAYLAAHGNGIPGFRFGRIWPGPPGAVPRGSRSYAEEI